jgi:hypothetical protein
MAEQWGLGTELQTSPLHCCCLFLAHEGLMTGLFLGLPVCVAPRGLHNYYFLFSESGVNSDY